MIRTWLNAVCVTWQVIAELKHSSHITLNDWFKFNSLNPRKNSLPNKYHAIPLWSETNIESIKTSFHFWLFSCGAFCSNSLWEHISAVFSANAKQKLSANRKLSKIYSSEYSNAKENNSPTYSWFQCSVVLTRVFKRWFASQVNLIGLCGKHRDKM